MVDTNVLVSALLGEADTGAQAAAFLAAGFELQAPSHWKAELANVLWKTVKGGRIEGALAFAALEIAAALPIQSVDIIELWHGALVRALETEHPVYDVLFVELAARLGTRVVSYDSQLRRRFPRWVVTPATVLAEQRR